MVGVARIELATPAMSTRAAPANLLIFQGFRMRHEGVLANMEAILQRLEFNLNQANTVDAILLLSQCSTACR